MKKTFTIFSLLLLTVFSFMGCNKNTQNSSQSHNDTDSINIVVSIYPAYDWAKEICNGQDNVNITLLTDNGVDMHSFQPTADDLIAISDCDIFVYVGGESDGWAADAISQAANKDMIVLNLLDILDDKAKEEEIKEGMENTEENHSEHHDDCEDGDEEMPELDEHVWLSINNATLFCNSIKDALCKIDTTNTEKYTSNCELYCEKLNVLNSEYENAISSGSKKTLVFADRFPFRYLVDDYGLDYYAAFSGCSAEAEASFDTILFLAQKIDDESINTILILDGSDGALANTVKSNTSKKDQDILILNSMQIVTSKDISNGISYLSVMKDNLKIIETALK